MFMLDFYIFKVAMLMIKHWVIWNYSSVQGKHNHTRVMNFITQNFFVISYEIYFIPKIFSHLGKCKHVYTCPYKYHLDADFDQKYLDEYISAHICHLWYMHNTHDYSWNEHLVSLMFLFASNFKSIFNKLPL